MVSNQCPICGQFMKYEIINYDYYYECKRCKLIMPRNKIIYSLKTHNKIYNNIKGFNEDA